MWQMNRPATVWPMMTGIPLYYMNGLMPVSAAARLAGMQQPMQMTPAALQAAQNSMAVRLQQQQQQQHHMPQGGASRGLPGMLAGMPPNMAMRPHMGGFPNGPNGMPQMPQVRPQQPSMPGQMMPPGMVPPQVGCNRLRAHSSGFATASRPLH